MTGRFPWRQRESFRTIAERARETVDPVERLRYVRNQTDSRQPPKEFRWWPVRTIAAMIAAVIGAALLVWRIQRRIGNEQH